MLWQQKAATPEARQNQAAVILKDTFFTAIIAFAILGPIVGLKAEAPQGGLVLRERWGLALVLVAIVTAGRLALNLFWWARPEAKTKSQPGVIMRALEPLSKYIGTALLVLALLLPFLPGIERRPHQRIGQPVLGQQGLGERGVCEERAGGDELHETTARGALHGRTPRVDSTGSV